MTRKSILFVCMGNICRSPTAEGVFRAIAQQRGLEDQFEIDSAGTGSWHTGNPPDERAQHAAMERGVDLSALRARQVSPADIEHFDWIIAMDRDNLETLQAQSPQILHQKIRLLLEFSEVTGNEQVPDPYYGGEHGFDHVLDLIEDACNGFISHLTTTR